MNASPDLRTVPEVAGILQVHPKTVRRWIDEGRIPSVRIGRLVRVREADLQDFIQAGAA